MIKKSKYKISKVEEPQALYRSVKRLPTVADYGFKKFEKLSQTIPFTQKEWATILHLSERTLQRYAKENKNFEGIYVDRILQIQQLVELGLEVFENADTLYRWLKRDKQALGHTINFESLYTAQGIQDILDELGRIQHGVYI